MKKFLTIIIGFILGFYIFMPKTELFYFLENVLAKEKININADINSNPLKLNLSNGKIYYNSIKAAEFKRASVYPYIFYNKLNITDLKLPLANMKINKISIKQNILHPFTINVTAESNFAKNINGKIDLKKREIKIRLSHINNNSVKRFLKKDKKGYYYYEKF